MPTAPNTIDVFAFRFRQTDTERTVMEMVKLRLELITPGTSAGAIDNIFEIWMYHKKPTFAQLPVQL